MTGASSDRLGSLDAARGFAIVGMIVVNTATMVAHMIPGGATYAPLLHAEWVGCTPADVVFPAFLFFMGVALSLSMGDKRDQAIPWLRLSRRLLILVLLGLGVNALQLLDTGGDEIFRVNGVLQRIGVVYFFSVLLYLRSSASTRLLFSAVVLLGYAAALEWIHFPGVGAADLWVKNLNVSAWFDLAVRGASVLQPGPGGIPTADPESFLSIPSSMVGTVLGTIAGDWIRQESSKPWRVMAGLAGAGALLTFCGGAWGVWHPLSKHLWTSSFTLYTTGGALLIAACFYGTLDMARYAGPPLRSLEIFGSNSITAYLLHILGIAVITLAAPLYLALQPALSAKAASLVMVAIAMAFTYAPIWGMHRRGWMLRL